MLIPTMRDLEHSAAMPGMIAAAACREFGEAGPFWGRQYFFWHNDKPLTLIYEVFSPALQRLLGPALLQR